MHVVLFVTLRLWRCHKIWALSTPATKQQLALQINQMQTVKKQNNHGKHISINCMFHQENQYFMTIFQNLRDGVEFNHLPASVLEIFSDTFEAHN